MRGDNYGPYRITPSRPGKFETLAAIDPNADVSDAEILGEPRARRWSP